MRAAVLAAALAGAGCWTSTSASTLSSAPVPGSNGPPGAAGLQQGSAGSALITCTDVGIVLRGSVERHSDAGPAKERAIEQACLEDAWSRAVIDCVGRGKKDCLELLTAAQRRSYDGRISRWQARFAIDPARGDGDGDGDGDGGDDADAP